MFILESHYFRKFIAESQLKNSKVSLKATHAWKIEMSDINLNGYKSEEMLFKKRYNFEILFYVCGKYF